MAPDPDPERDAVTQNDQGPPKLIKFRHMLVVFDAFLSN